MTERITIVLADDLVKKLREKQAKEIQKKLTSVSFSKIINDILRNGL